MALLYNEPAVATRAPGLEALGPRAQSKERTRAAIVAESLSLFDARGYDRVTTQEIADAVGVTQRTLFRYFERKDSIIYESEYNYVMRFEGYLTASMALHDQPYEAVRDAFSQLAAYFAENHAIVVKVYAIIQRSEQLKTFERTHQMRIDWLVACALDGPGAYAARVASPSLQSRIVASVLFGAIRPTLRAWLTGEIQGDLRDYADLVWDHIRPTFNAAQHYAAAVAEAFQSDTLRSPEIETSLQR
jgi:AcrR family transcriptional regulator